MTQRFLTERPVAYRRLGRHINHDPRSLNFLVREIDQPVSRTHRRYTPILDQLNTSSCTGNAATGVLGTGPFYGHLLAKRRAGLVLDESTALSLYSAATRLDPFPGYYPDQDTGSDGLSVAKACKAAGLISGYLHITSLAAAHNAIATSPFIMGSYWYSAMDDPDSKGVVTVSGQVRGGHEFEVLGYSARTKLWKAANSWGAGWGRGGYFWFNDTDMARLLAEDGDGTVFVL